MLSPGKPRHQQVSDWIREQIQSAAYPTGRRLPSESELMKHFGVSRITVRRALQTVESQGLIFRRQGLGSFVSDRHLRQGLKRLTSFAEDMAAAGIHAGSRLVGHDHESAGEEVASALQVEPGTRVIRYDRIRLGDDEAIAFDKTWMPLAFAQLVDPGRLGQETIYSMLERNGVPVIRGTIRVGAANATDELRRHLDVPWGRALLVVDRIPVTDGERVIYFQRRYYRNDRVTYELELQRAGPDDGALELTDFGSVVRKTGTEE